MPIDEKLMDIMRETMPPFFARSDVANVTNGAITPGYITKLSSTSGGPPKRFLGTKCFFVKEEFLEWMERHYASIGPDASQQDTSEV